MKWPTFISDLNSDDKKLFDMHTFFNQGDAILSENEQCAQVLFLIRGEIEVYKMSANGKVFSLYTIREGESCVLNLSCVLSSNNYLAYARAITDLECILLPTPEFLRLFQAEQGLRSYVFDLISNRLIQVTAKVEGIVLESLETRLRDWLISQDSDIIYTTHDEIAIQLGSAREVISRQLKKWEKESKVQLFRGKIKVLNLM